MKDEREPDFARALLALERLRVNVLLAVLAGLLAVLVVLFTAADPDFSQVSTRAHLRFGTLFVVALAIPFEFALRRRVARCIAVDEPLPAAWRLTSVLVEVMIPTVLMLGFVAFLRPTEALTAPPLLGYGVIILLATLSMDFAHCVLAGLVSALAYAAMTVAFRDAIAVDFPGTFLAIWPPYAMRSVLLLATGLVAGFVTREIRSGVVQALVSRRERDRIRELFGQHVSPAVVRELLDRPDPAPEERRLTVLFVDIRGFTRFAADRSPREVVDYLNLLFGPLSLCVDRNHGFINKFLGDGFMAVFGAPIADPAAERHAVAAAREIVAEVERLVAAGVVPPTEVGVGLHAGVALTGNVGSSERKEYTIIGDTVNLAARIEQLNKAHGSRILASAAVIEALGADAPADAVALGPTSIRGRDEPIALYRLA